MHSSTTTPPSLKEDKRPKTVVLHQQTGIGDLIWHIPYVKAIAAQSYQGKVSFIAAPSTLARQIMAYEDCIDEFIDYYHLPRTVDRGPEHGTRLSRMRAIIKTIKSKNFDRIVLLSGRASRGYLAFFTGIPQRLGYGYRWTQRIFLNSPPYIKRFEGKSNPVYHDATAFAIAQGFTDHPIIPRMVIPETLDTEAKERLKHLSNPIYTLAIGSSEDFKQWGTDNYAGLAEALLAKGFSVLLLGGKVDNEMAHQVKAKVDPQYHAQIEIITDTPIMMSAALVKNTDVCIGNDTGLCQIAAACETLCYIIMGARPTLDHDPIQHYVVSDKLLNITVQQVMNQLADLPAPGFNQKSE